MTRLHSGGRYRTDRVVAVRGELAGVRSGIAPTADSYALRRPTGTGFAVGRFPRDLLIRLTDYPDLPLRMSAHDTIKAGRSTLLLRLQLPIGGKMTSVAYKRARFKHWWKAVGALFRPNAVLRTWRLGRELERHGISTAAPLAAIVPSRWSWRKPSYLMTVWLDDTQNVSVYGQSLSDLPGRIRHRRARSAAKTVGQLLGTLHARGFSHRDLKPANILLVPDDSDGVEAYVIDLDGARQHRHVSRHRRLRNLSRLAVAADDCAATRSDQLRFLKAWLIASDADPADWKRWWRDLSRITRRRAMLRRRSGVRTR